MASGCLPIKRFEIIAGSSIGSSCRQYYNIQRDFKSFTLIDVTNMSQIRNQSLLVTAKVWLHHPTTARVNL